MPFIRSSSSCTMRAALALAAGAACLYGLVKVCIWSLRAKSRGDDEPSIVPAAIKEANHATVKVSGRAAIRRRVTSLMRRSSRPKSTPARVLGIISVLANKVWGTTRLSSTCLGHSFCDRATKAWGTTRIRRSRSNIRVGRRCSGAISGAPLPSMHKEQRIVIHREMGRRPRYTVMTPLPARCAAGRFTVAASIPRCRKCTTT